MPLDFNAAEQALLAWVATCTGLTQLAQGVGGRSGVLLEMDKMPQPAMPYVTVKVPEPQRTGGQDELRGAYNAGAALNQEITPTVYGVREMVVSLHAYSKATVGAGTARELLSKSQTGLSRPSVIAALAAAGLASIDVELFQDLTQRAGPVGQGHAVMDVRFRCVDTQDDTAAGYIGSVGPDATTGAANPTGTFS